MVYHKLLAIDVEIFEMPAVSFRQLVRLEPVLVFLHLDPSFGQHLGIRWFDETLVDSGIDRYRIGYVGGTVAFTPALADATMTSLEGTAPVKSAGGTRGGVVVQFTYAPAVSLGDRYEAEQVLTPMIADAVRRRLEQEG